MTPIAERGETLDLPTQMRLEVLEMLARQGPATFGVSLVNASAVYVVLRDAANDTALWSWTSAIVAFTALRIIMAVVFWRMPRTASFQTWTILYLVLIYLSGLCWGSLALFPAFYEESWVHGFIIFVIAGMSAGGMVALYPLLSAAIPYYLAAILPLVTVLAAGNKPEHFAMALLGSLFLVLLVRSTYVLNGIVRKTIRLEIENEQLFEFLVDAREIQDKTLRDLNA